MTMILHLGSQKQNQAGLNPEKEKLRDNGRYYFTLGITSRDSVGVLPSRKDERERRQTFLG